VVAAVISAQVTAGQTQDTLAAVAVADSMVEEVELLLTLAAAVVVVDQLILLAALAKFTPQEEELLAAKGFIMLDLTATL
jgi:hypothetical protein